jgi:hypothetical protein
MVFCWVSPQKQIRKLLLQFKYTQTYMKYLSYAYINLQLNCISYSLIFHFTPNSIPLNDAFQEIEVHTRNLTPQVCLQWFHMMQ